MHLVIFLLSTMLVCAQSQDVVISSTARQTCSVRLVQQGGEQPQHAALFVRMGSAKRAADSSVSPITELSDIGLWIEVAGRTPDSSGVVLSLTSAKERAAKPEPRIRHVVLRARSDEGYALSDIDGHMMESLRDIVQGARMVFRGETNRPVSDLPSLDPKQEPYDQLLSMASFAVAGVERLTPMWLLSSSAGGAENVLTYGYDDGGNPTVQVVRIGDGPLRRLIFQRGAIVGVTPVGMGSPTIRVFDESSDSGRYARAIRYVWDEPTSEPNTSGRYVAQAMSILSACVIPPKRFAPFPLAARLTSAVRLGFAPGSEGCSSSRHDVYSWPFGKPLDAATPCEILATANDAADIPWTFIGVREANDPAVRRSFGDHGTSESEQVITGGWVPASSLEVTGIPGAAAKP